MVCLYTWTRTQRGIEERTVTSARGICCICCGHPRSLPLDARFGPSVLYARSYAARNVRDKQREREREREKEKERERERDASEDSQLRLWCRIAGQVGYACRRQRCVDKLPRPNLALVISIHQHLGPQDEPVDPARMQQFGKRSQASPTPMEC